MKYELWQLKQEFARHLAFRSLDSIGEENVIKEHYHCTYKGEDTNGDHPAAVLENIFRIFNIDHPADFTSYSMSMGDIVVLENGSRYYCDTVGFKQLEGDW